MKTVCGFACILLALLAVGPQRLMADTSRSWEDAVPVQFAASDIDVMTVRSTWASDYDYGLHMQGPIYFNDCVTFRDSAGVAATHVQFIFAAVDWAGAMKTQPLPLDVRYAIDPGRVENRADNCRDHAYANGAGGLWLVAWVNRVNFADGTSWTAPTGANLTAAIRAALQLHRVRTISPPWK